ncbi:MAG: DNA replication/repair protein RecF [Solirubrobacteraceae bacterium]
MRVLGVTVRDFRGYEEASAAIGDGVTIVSGPNGCGKTNLLEAVYVGCTGRSCRTNNDRELVRFGAPAARVILAIDADDGPHELSVGLAATEPKRIRIDGVTVDGLLEMPDRPLVSVFLPDRLELIKGAPARRRAHLDQFVAALWPARSSTRRAYAGALVQRNALLGRIRAGQASRHSLASWDAQLARHGIELMEDRRRAIATVSEVFCRICGALALDGRPALAYRPRSHASEPAQLAAELAERVEGDLERGFTAHGPHRDELLSLREGRDLRIYGSQGQQRLALLALLLAEREAITACRSAAPLMLLDDVMSELDRERRRALVDLLRDGDGQSVITTTDLEHVPGARDRGISRLVVSHGRLLGEAVAA